METAIIILNYRTAALTIQCLRSLAGQLDPSCNRVVVVEGCSGDDSARQIQSAIADEKWDAWASLTELTTNLKHDVNPDLCGKLASLYNFMYRRLVDANLTKNPQLVDDALEIMRHQRETWGMLIEKLSKERASEASANRSCNS